MAKKNVRKTLIEASGQTYFENKTRNLGYLMINDNHSQIADILKEIHFTHKVSKGDYLPDGDHLAHVFNWHDLKKKLRAYRKTCDATLNSRYITETEKQQMLKSLVDISIYANLGMQLWFDKFGDDE